MPLSCSITRSARTCSSQRSCDNVQGLEFLKEHGAIENVSALPAATAEAVHQLNRATTPKSKYYFKSGPVD